MQISAPNENNCLASAHTETVAWHSRSYAAVHFSLGEDGCYRISVELRYSYGGFAGPIWTDSEGFATIDAVQNAGMEPLLRRWHKPFPSNPQSVHDELRIMREQIESRLFQPTLF